MLFQTVKEARASFSLFDNHNRIKCSRTTSFSLVITRRMKLIFERETRRVERSSDALYLECIGKPMPVEPFIRRRSDTIFIPECRDQYMMAYHWMNYLNISGRAEIQHNLNHGSEKRVGKYLVDGGDSNTIYQYQWCYFHGHQCDVTTNVKDPRWKEERD
jgi:hypothetical protein